MNQARSLPADDRPSSSFLSPCSLHTGLPFDWLHCTADLGQLWGTYRPPHPLPRT